MLVLSRKHGECVRIGDFIEVKVLEIDGNRSSSVFLPLRRGHSARRDSRRPSAPSHGVAEVLRRGLAGGKSFIADLGAAVVGSPRGQCGYRHN